MWLCAPGCDKDGRTLLGEMHVEQTVAVQVRELHPMVREADPTEAVHTRGHIRQLEGSRLQRFHRTKPRAVHQSSPGKEQCVKKLRRKRQMSQPAQVTDNEAEHLMHRVRRAA